MASPFSQMIIHSVTFASLSVSLGMSVPPSVIDALENSIRDDLQSWSHEFFWWVLFSAGMVAVGCILEGPEIAHELFPRLTCCFTWQSEARLHRFENRVKKIAAIGWLLICLGVLGEGVFESLQNRAEGQLQTFNDILLSDAKRQTTLAIERAGSAANSARDAADAAEKANKAELELEKKANALQDRLVWLGTRDILIFKKRENFKKHLSPFKGQRVVITICGEQNLLHGDQELWFPAAALAGLLYKAQWRNDNTLALPPNGSGLIEILDESCPSLGEGISVFEDKNAPDKVRKAAIALEAVIDDALQQGIPVSDVQTGFLSLRTQGEIHTFGPDTLKIEVRMHPTMPSPLTPEDRKFLKIKP